MIFLLDHKEDNNVTFYCQRYRYDYILISLEFILVLTIFLNVRNMNKN